MLRFSKVHGLGNDFVLLDRRSQGDGVTAALAVALCDRHRGIGADGVLTLLPSLDPSSADVRVEIHNADGSRTEMCGNGLRCVARYVWDNDARAQGLRIQTGAGVFVCDRVGADRVRVHMGRAELAHPALPKVDGTGQVSLSVEPKRFTGTPVWLGNPHFVVLGEEAPMGLAERYGADLERHPAYPQRANVSFVRRAGGDLEVVVFERGVGITRACGSGACASAVAAVERRWIPADREVRVHLPGGPLGITVRADRAVLMEGDAVRVYEGSLPEGSLPGLDESTMLRHGASA